MKTRVLIIEDNYFSYYTSKQLIESQLRLNLKVKTADDQQTALVDIGSFDPDVVMYHVEGGAVGLFEKLKARRYNRRNCEITILLIPECLDSFGRRLAKLHGGAKPEFSNRPTAAAA